MTRKITLIVHLVLIISTASHGQSVTLGNSIIYSRIDVPNNWSPPTSVNRENQFDGSAIGYGVNLNYSFRPVLFTKNERILVNIGVGYFKQQFDLRRPFDYVSPLQPVFYADNYSYHCWEWLFGVTYNYPVSSNYFLSGTLLYSGLRSFQQEYTPTSNYGYGHLTQINHNQIDFGNTLILTIGPTRNLGERFSLGLNILIPLFIRWRNDKIFKDDPNEFSHPKISLGSNLSIVYLLKKKH